MPFGGLSIGELILIFAVLLLLFGPKRLPELAAGVGKGIRDFKRSLNGLDEQPLTPRAAHAAVSANPAPSAAGLAPASAEATPVATRPEQPLG